MKRLIVVFLLLVVSLAHANVNIEEVARSQTALVGAISGYLGDPIDIVHYIPGYGLHMAFKGVFHETEPREVTDTLHTLLTSLSATVRGLGDGDFLSVYYRGHINFMTRYELLVRMQPGQPDTFEAWLDGIRQ
jgi:hypothetical protein